MLLSVLYKIHDSINVRRKGSAVLVMAIVAAALVGFISLGSTKTIHDVLGFSSRNSTRLQAQSYAVSEAEYIRAIKYHDLNSLTEGTKQQISDTDFYKQVVLSAEENYTSNVKRRIATVDIYKGYDSTSPVYTIKVYRYYNGTGTTVDPTI